MMLRQQAAQGVLWSVVQHWGGRLLTMAVFVVLVRVLEPADFGLVALAMVIVAFCQVFQEQGFGHALVQRKDLESEHLDTAFWTGMLTGTGLMAVLLVGAGPLADLLDQPRLEPIVQVLSLTFVLAGLNGTQTAVVRRGLKFKTLAVRTLTANTVGGVVALVCAFAGFGVWALVVQSLVKGVVSTVALWSISEWRPRRRFSRRHFQDLFGFGVNVTGSNVLEFFSRKSDDLLIGVFLGPVLLGFYTVAYRVQTLLGELLMSTVQSVTLPVFAKAQKEPERLRRGLMSATRLTSAVALPTFVATAALAPEIVEVAFGSTWREAVPVMRILALVGIVAAVNQFNGNVMMALGKPQWKLRLSALGAVLNVVGFALAVRWGIAAVAAAYVIRGYLLAPVSLLLVRRLIALDLSAYLRQFLAPALGSAVLAGTALATTMLLLPDAHPALRLGAGLGLGALGYAATMFLLARTVVQEAAGLVRLVGQRA